MEDAATPVYSPEQQTFLDQFNTMVESDPALKDLWFWKMFFEKMKSIFGF